MKPWEEFAETATVEAGPWDDFKESAAPAATTGPWDDFKEAAPEPDRSFSGALKQGLDAPLEAIGTTAEVLGLPSIGKAIKGLTEAPVNYESAGQRVAQPQPGDFTVGGFGVGSIPRAITEQLGQVAGSIVSRAVGALAGRAIGSAIGGSGGAPSGPGALLTAATGGAVGSKVGSFLGPFAFGAMQIAGPTALERARNNGRTEPNKEDLAVALTTAASSGALDAIGAKFLPGGEKAVGSWVGKIGKAMLGEFPTETLQDVAEQTGGTIGTEAGLKVDWKQAVASGGIGAGAAGTAAAVLPGRKAPSVEVVAEEANTVTEQVDATIDEVAAAEPPPVVNESGEEVSYQDNEIREQGNFQASEGIPSYSGRTSDISESSSGPSAGPLEGVPPDEGFPGASPGPALSEGNLGARVGIQEEVVSPWSGEVLFDSETIDATEDLRDRLDPKRRTAQVYRFPPDEDVILYRGISEAELKAIQANPEAEILGGKYSAPIEREFGAQYSATPEEAVRAAFHDEKQKGVAGQPKYLIKVNAKGRMFSHLDPRATSTPELSQSGRYRIPLERVSGNLGVSVKVPFSEVLSVEPLGADEKAARQRFSKKSSVDDQIRAAYEEAVAEAGTASPTIASVLKKTGMNREEFQAWLREQSREGNVIPARGDWSLSDEETREAGIQIGQGDFSETMFLRMKLADQFRQGSGTADTTATEQISPTGQQPTTPETETEVSLEAAPQGVSTENLSAAQLEERIVTVLGKRSSAKTEAEKKQYLEEVRSLTAQLMEAERKSEGPGAAASSETLADYAERKFGVRFGEDPRMAPELKEAAGNRFYEVLPNKVTAREATDLIDRVGDDQAERLIRDDKGDASFAVRSTVGQILIQRLNKQYQSLKETNPEQAEAVLNRAADLAEWQMEFGTRLGQGVQAFSMWMKLTPEGKLLGIKKAVRKARERHRQQHEKEVGEVLDVLGTDRTQEKKTTDMQRLGKKNRVARRVRKKIRQLTEKPQDVKSFYDIASKELGLPELTPEQELELRDLAGKVDAAKEGLPKWEASRKFWDKAKKVKGFTAQDLLLGYYYGNILSGAGTQIVNAVDTLFNVIHEANTLAISNPQAAATIYAGLGRGLVNSKADAFLAISKGRRISSGLLADTMGIMEESKFGQKGGVDIIGKDAFSRMAKNVAESKVAAPLNAWKYIGRLMSASDAVMFRGAQEMRAGLLAYRIATEEGLTNSQRTKRVNEILGWDRVDEFMAQAKEEGYSGNEQAARAAELMIMQRPEGLQQDSSAFAAESTYNHKPEGLLGLGSELAGRFSDKYPAFRLIVPFTNIVANVFNRRLDNLPLVALYRSKKGYYGSEEAGKNAITRMLLSSAMLTTLISMSATGLFEITGQGPEDPEKKRQLKETGWRPYSLKIGDKYYSYASTPISLGLGIIGNMQDWSRYRKPSKRADKAFTEALVYSVFGLGSYLFSQSFISGMANFFDTMSGNTGQREFAIRNFTSQTASSVVPLTGLLKDIDTVFDDARKETKTMGAAVLASIPFARYAGKPALNAFGEPIKTGRIRPLSRFVSEEKKDNAWQVVNDKQLRVPVPDPFFMTDDQNYEFQKESGKQTKQWVLDNAEKLKDMSTEKAQKLMSNETEKIRDGIKASLMMKFLKEEEEANAQGKN